MHNDSKVLEKISNLEIILLKNNNLAETQKSKPLNFQEACAYLGYKPSYLYKLSSQKLIPSYKPSGKKLFFSKEELDEWIFGRYGEKNNCELRIENRELRGRNE